MHLSRRFKKPGQEFQKQTREFRDLTKIQTYYNFGVYAAIFGLAFLSVPLYRIYCEHTGLVGDYSQKDYSAYNKDVNKHRKFAIAFKAESDPEVNWEFEQVQDKLYVNAGETALMFYRAYNAEPDPVIGFSTYQVFPEEAQAYFSKIQCFCFNQQLLNPKEELQLPLYFYLEPEILEDKFLEDVNEIRVVYTFIKCLKQDMLKYVEEELERVKQNKAYLEDLRAKKRVQDRLAGKEVEEIAHLRENISNSKQGIELLELKKMELLKEQAIEESKNKNKNKIQDQDKPAKV
ncbi:Cytochrome c oxidase assembly protein CtaG/Cox11, domain [Pseudocohnilembus persalinus]|uniref:Cytochrome c oxidase assembly protein CtaG/Cox11, domain n=1 Tax=Pseudocohnilembus persalinus TaxID=266149 RepID=A0A0V0QT20_PSEPJ|nr:Cytochrome c oxidase assembly protein CtaG/Cox11, domain [Pseudocohnilembus persalinus]|eukprot:KRX05032.1 Cytochrome c oxidase assembly protein CtaG/Cox11, domain [Pseudocohnilembus persalinus]